MELGNELYDALRTYVCPAEIVIEPNWGIKANGAINEGTNPKKKHQYSILKKSDALIIVKELYYSFM